MAHAPADDALTAPGPKVLSVSKKNPNVRTVQVVRPPLEEASFIPAILKGLSITVKHFFRNVVTKSDVATLQYPEEKQPYPERNRGLHRLMLRDDGSVRCVACMCCPTVCPANCITIVPAESPDGRIEKYPAVFEIDELRCVVCGLCVEACPCDAIRMDTGMHAPSVEHRAEGVMGKADLLALGIKSTAVQGGEGASWRDKPAAPDPLGE
jgi:NADH-quinone oxidoreductase subunit I